MHQDDFSLYQTMHLDSDVIFANQTDRWGAAKQQFNGHDAAMYATDSRGVGNNRNIALLNADAEICLLADDDIVYRDGYAHTIVRAFDEHPEADVIIFNIGTTTPEFGRIPTVTKKFKRLHRFSPNPYGAPRIAFRLQAIRQAHVTFSPLFGGGCPFTAGEDSVFINDLLRNGLRVYISPDFIGDVSYAQTSSFSTDIEEKLYNRGALLAETGGALTPLYVLFYSCIRKHEGVSNTHAFRLIRQGIRGYAAIRTYKQYSSEEKR